ncbi:Rpn family recombination-promoting nuclease/putative transposase [Paenibacillus barcinonensis]|uniref:Putative transposase/invertase (TIGR01784 family) n=1 Tax=Paenibacillus barcinonensis TaxID=198119 RepID=A0A2V4VZC3_PAEBA|nr:Rpn family recombination-promoting nuclease/putative transposase [Paenibacillus barcinonensis]PYE50900.1 putative transposase/invertase (TIGR01784 family) [Paenibacillus barcinonensis]QKS57566.1 Rpn family recombination-promoting nuclease/putative transposase [Paenibacillus barcinonensis]
MSELLDPKNDYVFKRIFGSEDNKDVLLAFLNQTFKNAGESLLTEIVLLNPYTDKNTPREKQSILDIHAKTDKGKLINVEMQLFNQYDLEKRTLFYWGKQFSGQLLEGQRYNELKKCVTINIINFSMLPNDQYHNIFHLKEDHTHIPLTDDLEIHFMEIPKLNDNNIKMDDGLVRWLLFLKGITKSSWEAFMMNELEPALKKAMSVLEFLSQDEQARQEYEARQKFLRDEASMIEGAREEGLKKGLEEGLKEGMKEGMKEGEAESKRKIAQNMLALGLDEEIIIKATGLSSSELKNIQQNK